MTIKRLALQRFDSRKRFGKGLLSSIHNAQGQMLALLFQLVLKHRSYHLKPNNVFQWLYTKTVDKLKEQLAINYCLQALLDLKFL